MGTKALPKGKARMLTTPRARLRRLLAVAGSSIFLVNCDEPLAPEDIAGTYASPLSTAGWVTWAPVDGAQYRAVAETLVVRADHTGEFRAIRWRREVAGADSALVRTRVTFQYTLREGRLFQQAEVCSEFCASLPYFGPLEVRDGLLLSNALGSGPYRRVSRATP